MVPTSIYNSQNSPASVARGVVDWNSPELSKNGTFLGSGFLIVGNFLRSAPIIESLVCILLTDSTRVFRQKDFSVSHGTNITRPDGALLRETALVPAA